MLRSDHDFIAKRYVVGSITLHALVFVCSFVSFFQPKKSDLLLMDIELAGEGELRDTLDQHQEKPPPEEVAPEQELPKEEESAQKNVGP
jgi:hypothetical protein